MSGHIGNFGADLISLGELQLELFSVDARDAARESLVPGMWAALGIGFAVGGCPLALFGLAWWLAETTTIGLAASSLIVSVVGLLLAGGCLLLAWRGFRVGFGILNRSRLELKSNLHWIKRILSARHRHQSAKYRL